LDAEAQGISEYFHKHWFAPERMAKDEDKRTSFAVLVRKRSQISIIESALRARNIPTEVIGVGGLIYVAEVADVLALMKVVTNPEAGTALMRHLTGPRLALGAKDIAALGAYSRKRAKEGHEDSHSFIAKIAAGNPDSAEADDLFIGSLIDALDEIDQCDKESRAQFSEIGFTRLSRFAADLRRLRSRAGGSIIDLITEIENYLNLDLEVSLRDGTRNGRRHLERFLDEASKFSRSGGSISAFIEWLDVTSKKEGGLKSGAPEVRSDVVQLLTVHTAKGAEWDFVAVPGLAEGTFPSNNTNDPDNWITNERQIPFALRGDGDELPVFSLAQCTKDSEAGKVIAAYAKSCSAIKKQEEIRLGYVAVTRARTHLLCTTSWWREGAKSVDPSELFTHVANVAHERGGVLLSETPAPEDGVRNPLEVNPDSGYWPRDPLGVRRADFDAAVALVQKTSAHSLKAAGDEVVDSWIHDAQALIAEVKLRSSGSIEVALPSRISTSTLVALHEDPEALALAIRRPVPRSQDPYSRRGTEFHMWVEKQFSAMTLFDDTYMDYFDPIEEDGKLEDLKKAWLSSEYANRTPAAIEVPFESVVGGVLIRGRIDAVYETADGFEVVDWKTGSKQLGESAAIQLAMYRLAWAKLKNIDVTKVSAAFHYVPTSVTDKRADLLDEAALVALIQKYNK
jgi:DNA helicase-2/ATP-dependent DNA helicase PcrA